MPIGIQVKEESILEIFIDSKAKKGSKKSPEELGLFYLEVWLQ